MPVGELRGLEKKIHNIIKEADEMAQIVVIIENTGTVRENNLRGIKKERDLFTKRINQLNCLINTMKEYVLKIQSNKKDLDKKLNKWELLESQLNDKIAELEDDLTWLEENRFKLYLENK